MRRRDRKRLAAALAQLAEAIQANTEATERLADAIEAQAATSIVMNGRAATPEQLPIEGPEEVPIDM